MSPEAPTFRPRRSVLYMPASNARALAKAPTLPSDAFILDLEDSVAPEAKQTARERAVDAVRSGGFGAREVVVRVNAAGTEWHGADLAAVCPAGPDAVLVPKMDSAESVRRLVAALEANGAPEHTRLWAMVETPRAMWEALRIAEASPRLDCLVMGTNDLVKELYAEHVPGRQPLMTGLGLVVLAARATGKAVLDGVFNDVSDGAGLEIECRQGRQLGFDGKTLIHPGQVAVANAAFSPSAEAVQEAEGIVEAWQQGAGAGVVTYRGRMVEALHVESARRTLSIHEAIRALQPEA